MSRYLLVMLLLASVLSGCAKIRHLPQLLTLKGLMEEQVGLDAYIEFRNQKFKEMVDLYIKNRLKDYPDKQSIVNDFGEPIAVNQYSYNDQEFEEWLYRPPVTFFKTDMIYLYFDEENNLSEIDYQEYIEEDDEPNQEEASNG